MSKQMMVLFMILAVCVSGSMAQDADKDSVVYGWKKEMAAGVNLTQTRYKDYVQGGENSLAWQFNFNFKFENDQEKSNWSNSGKLQYGMTKSGDDDAKKAVDEIKVETVYKRKLGIIVDPFVAATGETQLAPGYLYDGDTKTQTSDLADPLYFRESLGVGYKPAPEIATRLGAAMKQTLTRDFPTPYADDPETADIEKNRFEYGVESVTDLDVNLSSTSKLKSKLELFSNLEALDEIDVKWDTIVSAAISKYVNMNFNVKLFYDKDVFHKAQWMQTMAVGLSYSFY